MSFEPRTKDFTLSPYTGLTRESWLEAASYIIDGVFAHIKKFDDPVVVARQETEISYPHKNIPPDRFEAERRAEIFEGLTRTLFIAAPLLKNKPDYQVNGWKLADYYKSQILRTCSRGDVVSAGSYEDLQDVTGHSDPFRTFQQTVETCALVICLDISRAEIWETYTKEEKDTIASFLSGYAHASTVPQNWRLFNMLDMAFLHKEGYPVDEEIMADHAQAILGYYAGDGWYRDGQSFDYYSCWAFNVYAPIWNVWYGYKNMPYVAQKFEDNSNALMRTYPDFFDADGWMTMWGRSNIYRFAATSAFDGNFLLRHPAANPGLARRIASGAMMQFLSRDDCLPDGVPTLGFYRQFTPLVQGYSCAESPFWLGKAFLCLDLPADHPFWTAREENGSWETMKAGEVKETVLDGPALCFTNHQANGTTVLRTGKVVKTASDEHGMWNYSKLCFCSKYPWESAPSADVESQQYVLTDVTSGAIQKANATFWAGEKNGVLYRRQFFGYRLEDETHWIQAMNLADFPVANGIIRVDRHRLHRRPVSFTLGAYGFPDNGTRVERKERGGARAILLSGTDSAGRKKQMAMTVWGGWQQLDVLKSSGTNPDSPGSLVPYARTTLRKQYGGAEPYVLVSQVITRESGEPFGEDELFPIEGIIFSDKLRVGSYGPVRIIFTDGSERVVDFDGIEGRLSL